MIIQQRKTMKKLINATLIASVSLLFTACTSSAPVVKSPSFKQGEQDGCNTASGKYTKDGDAFKMDEEYKNGWYHGRKTCNPSQEN